MNLHFFGLALGTSGESRLNVARPGLSSRNGSPVFRTAVHELPSAASWGA
jgi:hypothetical protein